MTWRRSFGGLSTDRPGDRAAVGLGLAALVLPSILLSASACSRTAAKGSTVAKAGEPPAIDRVTPLPSPLPEVAARVNGQPVETLSVRVFASRAGALAKDKEPGAYREALQHFIVRELLFQEAVRQGLKADDRVLEQKYDEAHLPHKDEAEWSQFLRRQGLDAQTFRAELRVQYTIQALLQKLSAQAPAQVSDEEAQRFFTGNPDRFETGERLQASHILIRVPPDVAPARRNEFRTRVEGLLARIRSGEDFGKLAEQYSEDPGSKGKGGALQPFSRGQLHPDFEKVAFALKPGEVSEVVETPFGFHVIRLDERLPSRKTPFEEVRQQVKEYLQAQRQQQTVQAFVNGLRAKATIETYL